MNELELRPMFSYSLEAIIFVLILIGFIIYYLVNLKEQKQEKPAPTPIIPQRKNVWGIKEKYRHQIYDLKAEIEQNKLTNRKAYQKLSRIIRNFIFEMTKLKVQNYSLAEIRRLNMPVLTSLVEEYYDQEFSKESNGDALQSLEKTLLVIERWN